MLEHRSRIPYKISTPRDNTTAVLRLKYANIHFVRIIFQNERGICRTYNNIKTEAFPDTTRVLESSFV